MIWWREGSLFIGLLLGALCLAKVLSVGTFRITKKPTLIDHNWLVSHEREERLKAAAIWRGYKR
jgi:hypothetical protein